MKNETSKKVATKAAKVLKDPKASKDAKSIAASALKQAPAKVEKVEPWMPMVGQLFTVEDSEGVWEVDSFDPLVILEHAVVNGCHTVNQVEMDMPKNPLPLTRAEEIARLY